MIFYAVEQTLNNALNTTKYHNKLEDAKKELEYFKPSELFKLFKVTVEEVK